MKKTVTKRFVAVLMAFIMVCTFCNRPENVAKAATEPSQEDRYSQGYDISSILKQFQYFTSGDVTMNSSGHTVGAVVVGGKLDLKNTFGDAAIVPSYIKNVVSTQGVGNGWHGEEPKKCDTVYYGEIPSGSSFGSNWIQNSNYINTEEAFESIKKQSVALSEVDSAIKVVDGIITCSGNEDIYVTLDCTALKSDVKIVVKDESGIDWFKNHILCISVTGVKETEITFDGYSRIKINDVSLDEALVKMSGSDYNNQLNFGGMNLIWNFPDATGTIKAQGLGGHLVAPSATVDFQSGNYEGGVIAKSITGGAEGHFYPMSKTLKTGDKDSGETEPGSSESSSTEKSSTEDGSTEDTSTEKSSTEDGSTEDTSTEKPSTEKGSTEDTSTEKPSTEKDSTEDTSSENSSTESFAPSPLGNLEILVRDEKTKKPVPGATVELVYPDGHKENLKTDQNGLIDKNGTPIGEYTITVTDVPEGYDVSTGKSATALVETNKKTKHIAEIVTATTVTTDSAVKTGDSFEVVLPFAILIYSAVVMMILGYGKKNNK